MSDSQVVYKGRHAELYDLFYAGKDYRSEAQFVSELLKTANSDGAGSKVLELACGTGSYSFELEALGHSLVCLDNSADMLSVAISKGSIRKSAIEFVKADMRGFTLESGAFDAVVCLFDSLGYAGDNQAIAQVLCNVHAHLKPEGLFVFEFWHAPAVVNDFDPTRVKKFQLSEGTEVLRISSTSLNLVAQSAQVEYTIVELRDDGTYSSFVETQSNRFFSVPEVDLLLAGSNFKALRWFAGFDGGQEITGQTWHIVVLAQRL